MPEVEILLATYNGEKYLETQMDSILAQTFQDFQVIVRDDGSKDRTVEIIRDYEARYPGKIRLVSDNAVCGNPASNFMQLVKYATADYIMFADQDDYWLPEKVEVSLREIKRLEAEKGKETPILAFAQCEVVDAELNSQDWILMHDITETNMTFCKLLVGNCVTGCLSILNRSIYEHLGDYSPGILFHDWWAALYASAFGVLYRIPKVLMLYRQHGDNYASAGEFPLTEEGETASKKKPSFSRRFWTILKAPRKKFQAGRAMWGKFFEPLRPYCGQVALFRSRYANRLPPELLREVDAVQDLGSENRFKRLKAFIKRGYLKGNWLDKLEAIFYVFWA
ncbi:MAG: glycosyltransferase family 2 protein [Fretibacterium sp.]|nr:glycosyltransferase family 2 protein [Fretibacterium sp.]